MGIFDRSFAVLHVYCDVGGHEFRQIDCLLCAQTTVSPDLPALL